MSYKQDSPEVQAGRRGEIAVKQWAMSQGWLVLDASTIGAGATMFHAADGKVIALDQLHLRQGTSRWLDIKWKLGPVIFQRQKVLRHGIDRRPWLHYLQIWKQGGIDACLAIVELRRHRADSGYDPRLLMQSFSHLQKTAHEHVETTSDFPTGGVFWDRADFRDCGPIDIGIEKVPETQKNLHPWESLTKDGAPPRAYQRTYYSPRTKCVVCGLEWAFFEKDGLSYCWRHK